MSLTFCNFLTLVVIIKSSGPSLKVYACSESSGYLPLEYAMRGHLTEKADVFGFGVVALEILSGRPNADTSLDQDKIYLLEWGMAVVALLRHFGCPCL
ncbi:probable LRR receptor-like serine/threonine-protein kinase At1g56130 isoform X2 [Magnolia sinica]|uniref:probable LRR receptor-like serine/threonine-protein kinase At1g56130 isoform X2 n=1 Tax=Magnolia sinica TaxID=86752 RepID=UPI00265B2094|nr:probable LRR receptor-like serine/threonine-protein kinase At1g56130 isoform X2 [Magnolia sinica]